jgi:hypothetical protein
MPFSATSRKPDDGAIDGQTKFVPFPFERRGVQLCAIETPHVDTVAQILDLPRRAEPLGDRGLDILAALREDNVRAARGDLLGQDVEAAPKRMHVLVEVEAVVGVDHDRDAREPRCHLA